ncbi:thymidine kinase [Bacteroidota bacterium]
MSFEENSKHPKKTGWIEVITGSMFSGKTEELIRRIKRAKIANQKIELFKPKMEKRYGETDVISHDASSLHSYPVLSSLNILLLANEADVVGIDEAQFFDMGLVEVSNQLANEGKRVIIAGLDMDFKGLPFGPIPNLMAIAEYVTKVQAICTKCGNLAAYSHRKSNKDTQIVLGEMDIYEPLCRSCFLQAKSPTK